MQKTKKCVSKRFKVTGSGKLLRRKPGKRHFLRNKTVKQRRSARQDQSVSAGFASRFKQALPHA